jgi:hypothetical protein
MSAYRTYIMGSDAVYFDPELIKSLKDNNMFWWRLSYVYRSNWRVLHVDGLEGYVFGGHPLPSNLGERVQFFNYKVQECVKPS